MAETTRHTDPQDIRPRRALWPADDEVQVEVLALRRRFSFGRNDFYVEPTRGQGGRWVKESSLRWLEAAHE